MNRLIAKALPIVLSLVVVACAQAIPISQQDAAAWMRFTVPLPRQITLSSMLAVDATAVAIVAPSPADIVTNQACAELRASMGLSAGAPNPPAPAFTISMQIGGPESAPLQSLENSNQSYLIFPETGDIGLRVVALSSRGIYYGVKTLQQLIAARRTGTSLQVPLLTATDWPDMAERGLWGSDTHVKLRWMADRKMNYDEQIANRSVDPVTKIGTAGYKPGYDTLSTEGPKYGIQPQPVVLHLEQHLNTGAFEAYPQLQALGGKPGAMCFTRPTLTWPYASRVICDWIAALRQLPYVADASVWMTENYSGGGSCDCPTCIAGNISVIEGDAIVTAWEEAKARVGSMGLRMLTTEATKIAKFPHSALPVETKIAYYHSLLTYTAYKTWLIPTEMVNWVALGRYASVVPTLCAFSGLAHPFTSPQFVAYRMNEFNYRNLDGIMGYATPSTLHNRFNVEAAAEWSWSGAGRSVREFAVSWAVRESLPDPELFGDLIETLGNVTWDVYGGGWPESERRNNPGHAVELLQSGSLPELGSIYLTVYKGPWSQIKNEAQFDADVAASVRAVRLAQELGVPEFIYESRVANGYITALRALYKLRSIASGGYVSAANKPAAKAYFNLYVMGMQQAMNGLIQWDAYLYPPGGSGYLQGSTNSVPVLTASIQDMRSYATSVGCAIGTYNYPTPAVTVLEAKAAPDDSIASLSGEIVVKNSADCYIQDPALPVGIKVVSTQALPASTPVTVVGPMSTSNGERVVNAWLVSAAGAASPAAPVFVKTRDIGGRATGLQQAVMEWKSASQPAVPAIGIHNIGALVKIAGEVTFVGSNFFYVDDGCGISDGSGYRGIRVVSGSLTKPSPAAIVAVTGVSSTYVDTGGRLRRALLARVQTDIQ